MRYKKIFLVAGHHKKDSGAVADGFFENKLTIQAREGIKYFLNLHYPDIEVLTDDDSATLSQVLTWIRGKEGRDSIILDIHWNSAASSSATGVEVFISDKASQTSKQLAAAVLKPIVAITGLRDRGVKTESQSNRGRLGILNTNSPAALVELGFINNPKDREVILKWDAWIYEDVAHAIGNLMKNS